MSGGTASPKMNTEARKLKTIWAEPIVFTVATELDRTAWAMPASARTLTQPAASTTATSYRCRPV